MVKKRRTGVTVRELTLIAAMSAVITLCSWITIPAPPIPFTLQTFGVFASLKLLGGKKGTVSILLYILLGAVGLPVFAGFKSGIGTLIGPSGGYIVGFLAIGLLYWICEGSLKKGIMKDLVLLTGLLLCYFLGTLWYASIMNEKGTSISFVQGLFTCVVPYVIPDLAKLVLSGIAVKRIGAVFY